MIPFPLRQCVVWVGLLTAVFAAGPAAPAVHAQADAMEAMGYEAFGDAPVRNENYVVGRQRAVKEAFRSSLDKALRDMLGVTVYNENRKVLQSMYDDPEPYIQSYRFLEAVDDTVEKISRVKLEVVFFKEALNKELNNRGVLAALVKPRSVLVLLKEKSMTADDPYAGFWESTPIAEVSMYKHLVAKGIKTFKRDEVRDKLPDNLVLRAVNGDLQASVEVGLKAAAEVVVLGTALSTIVGEDPDSGVKTIQANLNVRAVSATKGTLIAAKSEIATVQVNQDFDGELKAFEKVSDNMVRFLADALNRYWRPETKRVVRNQKGPAGPEGETGLEGEPETLDVPVETPPPPAPVLPSNLPPNMGDL